MRKLGNQHIMSNSAKRRLILQEREAQSCDTRCIYHPQDMNWNLKEHLEVFLDQGRKSTKENPKETICEGSSWLEDCYLST